MTDHARTLRRIAKYFDDGCDGEGVVAKRLRDAADELDRLREYSSKQALDIVTLGQEAGRLREALISAEDAVRKYVPLLRPYDTGVALQKIMTEAAERVATIARAALAEQEK